MPHEEQFEWPSFQTVLRDVAPDSPTARSLASADKRARISAAAETARSEEPSPLEAAVDADEDSDVDVVAAVEGTPTLEAKARVADVPPVSEISPSSLPEPLAPLEIDTSSIRALLEPRATADLDSPVVEDALSELAPWPELDLGEPFAPSAVVDTIVVAEEPAEIVVEALGDIQEDDIQERIEIEESIEDLSLTFDGDSADITFDTEDLASETVAPIEYLDELPEIEAEMEQFSEESDVDDAFAEETVDNTVEQVEDVAFVPFELDDDSLVFELDDDEIQQVNEAHELETASAPGPLADPFANTDTFNNAGAFGTDDLHSDPFAFEPETVSDPEPVATKPTDSEPFDTDVDEIRALFEDPELVDDPTLTETLVTDETDEFSDVTEPADSSEHIEVTEFADFAEATEFADFADMTIDVGDLNTDDLETADLDISDLQNPEIPESVTSVPGIELPTQPAEPVELFDDLAPMSLAGLANDTEPVAPSTDTFEVPGLDLFDLNLGSEDIEQDRLTLHGEELYENQTFDSIAAADEIETDLGELIDFSGDGTAHDNVIPLRPDIDVPQSLTPEEPTPSSHEEGPLLTGGTGWVALDAAPAPQKPDPWADMRPSEEPKKNGFWANRPKFFGGDERRRRKSESSEDDVETLQQAVDITFDKECPRCGTECQVDLDDPIGRRVHVSCPSCQNIWYTPYILEDSQTG